MVEGEYNLPQTYSIHENKQENDESLEYTTIAL